MCCHYICVPDVWLTFLSITYYILNKIVEALMSISQIKREETSLKNYYHVNYSILKRVSYQSLLCMEEENLELQRAQRSNFLSSLHQILAS